MSDRKRINGNVYSWGSLVATCNGEEFTGIVALAYSQKRERTKQYGTGRHQSPRGRTRGKYSAEGKITVVRGTMADFLQFLADQSPDGVSYGDTEFQLVGQYVEDDETPMTVVLDQCVIASEDATDEEGNESLKDEIGLDVMRIFKNGLTLFDSSRG